MPGPSAAPGGFASPALGIDFIAHHALQAQAAHSVFAAMAAHFRCRWRLGADQAADGAAAAAVLLDHRDFHPRLQKARDGYRYLFHMSHDLGDIELYRRERLADFDLVLVPGRKHRDAAAAALRRPERIVEIGWPKYDPAALSPEHAAALEAVRALPHEVTILYAPTWPNTWEWRELIPWLTALPCNLVVKNHVLVDAGQPFPPGEEKRYAECRRSIEAMESSVRALQSAACVVAPPTMNLCALFSEVDALITDSSSCALEFLPFGCTIETGRTGAGADPLRDRDPQASELCPDVQRMELAELQGRFPAGEGFLAFLRAAAAGRAAPEIVAPVPPGSIGLGAARVMDAYIASHPGGVPEGLAARLLRRLRR